MQQVFGSMSFALSMVSTVWYITQTVRGNIKPAQISWFIWALLGSIYFYTAIVKQGAVLFAAGEVFGPAIIFLLSFKYGVGGRDKLDSFMLVLALAAIGLLITTRNTLLSLLLALTADGSAMIVTLKKLHADRTSESRSHQLIFAASSFFAILSITAFSFETLAFPVLLLSYSVYAAILAKPVKEVSSEKS